VKYQFAVAGQIAGLYVTHKEVQVRCSDGEIFIPTGTHQTWSSSGGRPVVGFQDRKLADMDASLTAQAHKSPFVASFTIVTIQDIW
jgi:hypothetical protein